MAALRRNGRRFAAAAALALVTALPALAEPRHGIAVHGEPALAPDFEHLPYVDPNAPKGGRVVYAVQGTFDSLNPLIVRGSPASGIRGHVYESLLTRSYDEPFSLYGLLAETIDTPADRSAATFRLRSEAHFSDGEPVKPSDVVFSWELLKEKGRPNHRGYYGKVDRVEVVDDRTVRFVFKEAGDRELPMILGLMPILPKHATKAASFEQTSFEPPVGSGPYVVADLRPGERITYRRDPEYWGAALPINRGLNNFDEIRYDYYRDANTMFEAFKRGLYDVRPEADPTRWATGYDFPAVRRGEVLLDRFSSGVPRGMNAFVLNTRRKLFSDVRVREALGWLFDFEWANKNLFHGLYARTGSYYEGSELASTGRPAGERERSLLAPYPDAVRADILEGEWRPPESDASGRDRVQLRRALDLFREAGWELSDGMLRRVDTGEPFRFEILVRTKDQERIALAYSRWLKRAGVRADVRLVDAVQFDKRLQTFDFDVTQYFWAASLSPGNEQAHYWGSEAAAQEGSRNYMGVKSPAVDAMIAALLAAEDRDGFTAAVRALDRTLLSGFYVVPLFHLQEQWAARWAYIGRPERSSLYGPTPEAWWRVPGTASQ